MDSQQVAHQRVHVVREHQLQDECAEMACGAQVLEVLRLDDALKHLAPNLQWWPRELL